VSKQTDATGYARGHYGKGDLRYWQSAVFHPTYRKKGVAHQVAKWAIKIQHLGHRETFPLTAGTRAAAAAKAKAIYLSLEANGWDETLAKFKTGRRSDSECVSTVGEFLEYASALSSARTKTVANYCRAFRRIVSDIFKLDVGSAKFASKGAGRQKWLKQVHAIRLADVTPNKVQNWKIAFLQRAGSDPNRRRIARASVNSLMRQAKSLFAPKILQFVPVETKQTPFDGVAFEPRTSCRYRSCIDLSAIVASAQQELPREQLKILLLAVMAGLRRNEIDKLEWSSFLWHRALLRIEPTKYLNPKSEDSIGDVDVDVEVVEFFRRASRHSTGPFVIESNVLARPETTYSHYRCAKDFSALTRWLRTKGVMGARPLHSLRKEFGSQVCAKHGIYAASRALRHADIAITSKHYLEPRRRSNAGLGTLLKH
jgi:integrase